MLKVFHLIYVIKNINIYILLENQIDKKNALKKTKKIKKYKQCPIKESRIVIYHQYLLLLVLVY